MSLTSYYCAQPIPTTLYFLQPCWRISEPQYLFRRSSLRASELRDNAAQTIWGSGYKRIVRQVAPHTSAI
ncbi:MAG: hypothetical protein OXE95_07435 [Chloroflexi bacterium]|nr:hypothetical protein [Chloroflexota bacterium]